MSFLFTLALLLASFTSVFAQTFTDCNPIKEDCPPNPALGTSHQWYFNDTLPEQLWNITNGELTYTDEGAEFIIEKKLQSPTLQSTFYIFFGIVEAHIKTSHGRGIVSSVVLQSDDLDEIDWEWVGSEDNRVQTNYYGKGVEDYKNGDSHEVDNPTGEFHNYTIHWTQEKLEWWIDGNLARTLAYEEAKNGSAYPQTPSNVRFGIWPAGDEDNELGTIQWAGGVVDYDAGPYTMVVKKVDVHDFHTGKEYVYTDHSGSWESIKVVEGNSTAVEEINKPPPKSLSEKWNDLPTGAKAGVGIGAAVAGGALIAAFVLFFIKQRRRGRLERALGDSDRTEMNNYNNDWRQSEWRRSGYQPVN